MPEARICPVCAQPLADRPERCFRCGTAVGAWWPFEASLAELVGPEARAREVSPVVDAALPGTRTAWVAAAALLAGVFATSAFWAWRGERGSPPAVESPAPLPGAVAVPSLAPLRPPAAPKPAMVAYRIQRGDSLWRIAAALTGDGQNWRTLWPDGERRRLRPGTLVQVPGSWLRSDAAAGRPSAGR